MDRIKEIEMRFAAIAEELEKEDADIDALEAEMNALKEERAALLEKAEKRRVTWSGTFAESSGS